MSAAAVDDVTAWTILAGILVTVRAGARRLPRGCPLLGLACFVAAAYLARNLLRRRVAGAFERRGRLGDDLLATLVALVLVGACITEAIGVHALFGSFLVGLMLARERPVALA
jgi:Kef-type K+ transport system membrane component KefB